FFTDLFTTALAPGEILSSVSIPVVQAGTGQAYLKHRHPASGYAVVGAAAVVSVSAGVIQRASIVVGGVTGRPTICTAGASALLGGQATDATIASASSAVADALTDPIGDVYASGPYRVHLATVMVRDA